MPARPVNLPAILKANGVASQLELALLKRIEAAGLPKPETQVAIIPGRKFTFDFVYRPAMLAIEVQGATFVKGGHSTGTGIARDCEKACLLAALGWRYMPVTKHQIEDGQAVQWIAAALGVEL